MNDFFFIKTAQISNYFLGLWSVTTFPKKFYLWDLKWFERKVASKCSLWFYYSFMYHVWFVGSTILSIFNFQSNRVRLFISLFFSILITANHCQWECSFFFKAKTFQTLCRSSWLMDIVCGACMCVRLCVCVWLHVIQIPFA